MHTLNLLRHSAVLLGTLAGAACAHSPTARGSSGPFHAFACPDDEVQAARAFGDALELALDVDSLEIISPVGGDDRMTVAQRGTPCSTATAPDACHAELSRRKQEWVAAQAACDGCNGAILIVTTRRDQVEQWTQPEELRTLLGAIDTPTDAWLLLMVRTGYSSTYSCGDASSSAYRAVPEGFELLRREWVSSCRPIERVEIVERFDREGGVRPVRRTVIQHEPKGCYVP